MARSPRSRSNASNAALDTAVRLLAARDRSECEVRRALAARGLPRRTIESTLRRLRQLRYVDDERFAASTAARAVRRGYGSERVRAELLAKGVAEALTEAAVRGVCADEMALAQTLLARRFGSAPAEPLQRARAARYLQARGFPETVVLAILEEGC